MIQEIVNYIKHLKKDSPQVLEMGLKPSKGLHIFVELDENGNAVNFPGQKGVNWDYYDGKEMSLFIKNIVSFDMVTSFITMNKQKKFDPKQKIHSASPFALSFNFNFNNNDKEKYGIKEKPITEEKEENDKLIKSKRIEVVLERLEDYFNNTLDVYASELTNEQKILVGKFKCFLSSNLEKFTNEDYDKFSDYFKKLKEKEYIKIYLKNIDLDDYKKVYKTYLEQNIFNKDKYNVSLNDRVVYGAIDFYTTFNDDKIFLKHQTALFKDGISYRFTGEYAEILNLFEKLKQSKIFPNPLPLFIEENEFSNADEIISIFQEDTKLSYSQILKRVFRDNKNRILQNYYLIFFNGLIIEDFDFVSRFRYSLNENNGCPEIKNLFNSTKNKEQIPDREIRNIFQFESYIVKTIFNNSLIKIDNNKHIYIVKYFGDIKSKYVRGGEPIYLMLLKYRKAFYDYIYKSKTQAINSFMWDEIMCNSILADLRKDKIKEGRYHSKEFSIKEKLNIWFSLYNYFDKKNRRYDMASKIPDLIGKMKQVAGDENVHFDNTEEFAFGTGQLIRKLLDASESGERTHALLEPFLQKTNIKQLNLAISRAFEKYKHAFKFYRGDSRYAFDKIMSEVMGFETSENLKKYLPMILAGYFAESVFKKDYLDS